MSSAVGDPPKKGKKMSAGRRAASRLSSGRCGSKTSGFPAQAANQPGLPSAAQPPGRRSVDESAPPRLRKHQHEGSKCQEQNRTEGTKCPRKPLQPPISSGALPRKLPAPSGKLHAGQLQKRRAHQDAAQSAKVLYLLQKWWQVVGPMPRSPPG